MTAPYYHIARILAAASLVAKRLLTPWRTRCLSHTVSTTITTTVRVIYRVHHHTTDGRTLAQVAAAAGFTDFDVLVLFVADDTDGRGAVQVYAANFAGRQADLRVITFFGHQLSAVTSTANHLSALAR